MSRYIYQIADEIVLDWKKPYFGAVPYLEAMRVLREPSDKFYEDSAKSIIAYFIANAATWRGDTARRIKAELKAMLK